MFNRVGIAPRFVFQISNFKFQISNTKFQIRNFKYDNRGPLGTRLNECLYRTPFLERDALVTGI